MSAEFDIRHFTTIDSTNTWVMEQARAGAPGGLVAVADEQTAGRGRLGRRWLAPAGASLLVSVLLRPHELDSTRAHLPTAAVAMAAADAIGVIAGFAPELKWPNDLLYDGRKLAGVLTEVDWTPPPAFVVGVGVNCNWPTELPAEIATTAVAANHICGQDIDRDSLLAGLLEGLASRLAAGWDEVGAEYARRCGTVGRTVRVEVASESYEGMASAVTAEGHLVVDTDAGRREVTAGDVVHLR